MKAWGLLAIQLQGKLPLSAFRKEVQCCGYSYIGGRRMSQPLDEVRLAGRFCRKNFAKEPKIKLSFCQKWLFQPQAGCGVIFYTWRDNIALQAG
ncbi:MAG TPA: hypothetical protein VIQ51_13505 [Chryseosolibacter sp.]|jgi:hypothetical protein